MTPLRYWSLPCGCPVEAAGSRLGHLVGCAALTAPPEPGSDRAIRAGLSPACAPRPLLDAIGLGAPACRHGAPEGADCEDCAREAVEDRAKWTDHDAYRADERGVAVHRRVPWREDEAAEHRLADWRRWRDLDEAREAREHAALWTEAPDDYEEGW